MERQVLHSQCKRLEAQNFNLTRTAEQLSLTVGVRVSNCILLSISFSVISTDVSFFCENLCFRDEERCRISVTSLVCPSFFPGSDESEAEGEGGTGETAGSARALQEVFDTTQRSLGQEPCQRVHPKVTSDTGHERVAPPTVKEL